MKKFFSLFLAFFLMLSSASASTLDFSSFSDDELILIRDTVLAEIQKRGLIKSAHIPVGKYTIGVDIPAGVYSVSVSGRGSFITVYPNSKTDDFLFYYSVDQDGIGKMELEDGQVLHVEIGSMTLTEYTGIVFK